MYTESFNVETGEYYTEPPNKHVDPGLRYKIGCIDETGTYIITYTISGTVNSNDHLFYQLTVNDVTDSKSLIKHYYTSTRPETISFTYIRAFTSGDEVMIQVWDDTNDGRILTTENININVHGVG